jgi:hypothetical protein
VPKKRKRADAGGCCILQLILLPITVLQWLLLFFTPKGGAELTGPGTFSLPIVGESYYQDALKAICGPRKEEGEEKIVRPCLSLRTQTPMISRRFGWKSMKKQWVI